MTIEDRNNKLKHFITCLKCEVSGKCCDDNCSTQYDAGNMGEIIENLEAISEALEQEPTTKNDLGVDCVARQDVERYIEGFINEYTSTEELEFINLELDGLKHIPSVTPQEPFINKPCVSEKVCEHDKNKALGKIRAEIEQTSETVDGFLMHDGTKRTVLQILDKYKAERKG